MPIKKKRDRREDVLQPPTVEAAAELHLANTCQRHCRARANARGSFLRRLAHLQRVPMRAQLLGSPSQPGQTDTENGHKRGTNSARLLCASAALHTLSCSGQIARTPKAANAFEAAPASRHLPRTCRSIPATWSLVLLCYPSLLCSVLELLLRFCRHMHVRGLLLQGFLGHTAIVDVDKSPEYTRQRHFP